MQQNLSLNLWLLVSLLLIASVNALAQVKVRGYYRKDGTYVRPHYRSSPDGNPYNNYSYPGNVNPYTGKVATGDPSIYLANYYKTYPYNSTPTTYNNYTQLLTSTDYRGMGSNGSTEYTVTENGVVTGRMYHYKERTYRIYDKDLNHIGYVKLNKSGRKYDVYDLYDYRVSTNRKSLFSSDEGYLYVLLLLGATAIVIGSE